MTWGTPVQSFVFLGLLVFELEPMYDYGTIPIHYSQLGWDSWHSIGAVSGNEIIKINLLLLAFPVVTATERRLAEADRRVLHGVCHRNR